MKSEDDEGWEAPTPDARKSSGSWQSFRDIAVELMGRSMRATQAKRSANIMLRDLEGAERCAEFAKRLGELAADFEEWPSDPVKAGAERVGHTHELFDLLRDVNELLAKMPGGPW